MLSSLKAYPSGHVHFSEPLTVTHTGGHGCPGTQLFSTAADKQDDREMTAWKSILPTWWMLSPKLYQRKEDEHQTTLNPMHLKCSIWVQLIFVMSLRIAVFCQLVLEEHILFLNNRCFQSSVVHKLVIQPFSVSYGRTNIQMQSVLQQNICLQCDAFSIHQDRGLLRKHVSLSSLNA